MAGAKVTIKDLPKDVLSEVRAFADPYFNDCIVKGDQTVKDMGVELASETGDLHPRVMYALVIMKSLFVRTLGEMVKSDRQYKSQIKTLKSEIADLKRKLS